MCRGVLHPGVVREPPAGASGPPLTLEETSMKTPILWTALPAVLGLLLAAGALPAPVHAADPSTRGGDPGLPTIRTDNGRVVLERAPDAGDRRRQVLAWVHRWRREIAPVHRASATVAHVLKEEHPSMLPAACRLLGRAVLDFDHRRLWPAPDYALHRHLRSHVDHLTRAATACLAGRRTSMAAELRRAHRAHAQAALALQRWDD